MEPRIEELTEKQKMFCKEYLIDLNATQAAIRAGYSERSAKEIGCENLTKPNIQLYIQQLMDKRSNRLEITADKVLQEIAKLAFGNVKNLYDESGKLKKIEDIEEEVAATIQEVYHEEIGDAVVKRKYKTADKKASLELLGKYLKLFSDKIELTGKDGGPIKTESTNINIEDLSDEAIKELSDKIVKGRDK